MGDNDLDFVHIIEKLQQKAAEDGEVTQEEEDFLEALSDTVEDYQKSMQEVYQDDFISADEYHELVIKRDAILTEAMNFDSDSDDINSLIQELFEEINKHEIPGMFEDEVIEKSKANSKEE